MSEKKKDDKNRWRNKTIAFRVSPEEAAELDKRWKLCGYATKQRKKFIIQQNMKEARKIVRLQFAYMVQSV